MSARLEVLNLRVRIDTPLGPLQAVDEVSFRIEEGETLALVGESGAGKSVTAMVVMGLLPRPPALVETGQILLEGLDLLTLSEREMRARRGKDIAMVFQDPMSSLNPFMTIGGQLAEVLALHEPDGGGTRKQRRARCAAALGEVSIPAPEERLDAFPHELSGGMRQRVLIAMAILCKPRVLIVDEPTTALDVTTQAQILELLKALQHEHGTSILAITHDLGVVSVLAHHVAVMYAGSLCETGTTTELFGHPHHPYTFGLLRSAPTQSAPSSEPLPTLPGSPPDMLDVPHGCAFHPRCPFATDHCGRERPPLLTVKSPDAQARRAAHMFHVGGRAAACFETERVAALTGLWTTAVDWATTPESGMPGGPQTGAEGAQP